MSSTRSWIEEESIEENGDEHDEENDGESNDDLEEDKDSISPVKPNGPSNTAVSYETISQRPALQPKQTQLPLSTTITPWKNSKTLAGKLNFNSSAL